ncbi:MAG: hypothetical protein ACKPKO_62400, partial [Candidatus Fonsibacter sp.]
MVNRIANRRSRVQILTMPLPNNVRNLSISYLGRNVPPAEAPAASESTIIIENAEAPEEEPEAVHWARFVDDVNNAPEILALVEQPAEAPEQQPAEPPEQQPAEQPAPLMN